MPIHCIQVTHRGVQHGAICGQISGSVSFDKCLHVSLLFAARAADFAADERLRRQPRRLIKPTRKDNVPAQLPGFFRENDENGLGNFLGVMGIARLPQCDRNKPY